MPVAPAEKRVRFGLFVLDLRTTQLSKSGLALRVPQQPLRLLAILIETPGGIVTREALRQRLWPSDVFVDFDHGLNKSMQKLREALGDSAISPRYVETVSRVGYRFICPVEILDGPSLDSPKPSGGEEEGNLRPFDEARDMQLPIVAETGPDAAKASAVESRKSDRTHDRRWIAAGVAVMTLAALLLIVVENPFSRSKLMPHLGSIAVLPVENLSGDPGQQYIADGLTDELITMLAKNSTLRVVSRTSVMQYKGAHRPLPELARALGADAVLEGSFTRSGSRTHVTLQLIRADNDSHIWAETYVHDGNDETVPAEAAQAVAERLGSSVPHPKPLRYIAPAAHDAYLQGQYLWPTQRSGDSGAFFRRATEIQPDYAEAWAGLANYYGEGIAASDLDPRIYTTRFVEAAERALALAPDLALPHQAMAGAYLIGRWDPENADREILLAIHIDPNDARNYYLRGDVLAAMNRFPEAIQAEKKFMELDPYEIPGALADMYVEARLCDDALSEIKLRKEGAPNDPMLLYLEKEAWQCKGNYKEAKESWARFNEAVGDPKAAVEIRRAYDAGGAKGFVRWELQRRLKQAKSQYVSPIRLAAYYAELGDKEKALPLIEEGYRQHSTDFLWVPDAPAYDFMHWDPRYQALMAKLERPAVRR